jgi:hypothetical protein
MELPAAKDESNLYESQWPESPFDFAKWLRARQHGACMETLKQFDCGLAANTLKSGPRGVPEKHVFAHQLRALAMVYVYMQWDAPVVVFQSLGSLDSSQLGVVTRHVKLELERHFLMPPSLYSVTQCLRPDIVSMSLKVWRHSPHSDDIDHNLGRIASEKWELNPYNALTSKILQALEWVGAAMLITGRKRDADIVIGPTFIITTRKDRMAAILVLMICAQNDQRIKALLKTGPHLFRPVATEKAIF